MRAAVRFAVAAATGAWMMGATGCSLVVSAGDYGIRGTDGGSGSTGYCSDLLNTCCPMLLGPKLTNCESVASAGNEESCVALGNMACSKHTLAGFDSGTYDGGSVTVKSGDAGDEDAGAEPAYEAFLSAPILLPGLGGGLDIYGGAARNGSEEWNPSNPGAFSYNPAVDVPGTTITIEQAQMILGLPSQAGSSQGTVFQGGIGESWGAKQEVAILYNALDQRVTDLVLGTGYQGTLDFKSADKTKSYSVPLNGQPIQRTDLTGSSLIILPWGNNMPMMSATVNELYDGLRATFAPSIPAVLDCLATVDAGLADAGTVPDAPCVVGNDFGDGGYLYFPHLQLAIFVTTTVGSPDENSAPILIDMTNPMASATLPDAGSQDAGSNGGGGGGSLDGGP